MHVHKYMGAHTPSKCPLCTSFFFDLHTITPKSYSLPPQVDFDSSSSWRCKSEIGLHSTVLCPWNFSSKSLRSAAITNWSVCLCRLWQTQALQQRNTCWPYQNTNLSQLATGISEKSTIWGPQMTMVEPGALSSQSANGSLLFPANSASAASCWHLHLVARNVFLGATFCSVAWSGVSAINRASE